MRILLIGIIVLLSQQSVAQQAPQSGSASVSGIVVIAGGSEPLAGVTVELSGVASRRTQSSTQVRDGTIEVSVEEFAGNGRVLSFSAITGSDGRFSFGNVPPGATYHLVATSPPSFLPAHYGQRNPNAPGRPIALAAGQRVEVRIPLTVAGSVSGRVLDSDGKPVRGAIVLPVAAEYNGDARVLNPLFHVGPIASTNSQGEYRLAELVPGVYYLVSARRPLSPFSREPEIPTFFPATVDAEKARPIHLEPGANLAGINIALVKTKLRSLRGVVLDEPAGKAIKATRIIAIARNADPTGPPQKSLTPTAGSSFEFGPLLPGAYSVTAIVESAGERKLGSVTVDLTDRDLRDVRIVVTSGKEVSGLVRFEGKSLSPGELTAFSVFAQSADGFQSPPGARVSANGSFAFPAMTPGEYLLQMNVMDGTFPDAYVKSYRYGNVALQNDKLQVEPGEPARLELVIGLDGGGLQGQVLDDMKQDVPNAWVALIPNEIEKRSLYKIESSDEQGRFTLRGIQPGDYRLMAWDYLPKRDLLKDPEFFRIYMPAGTPVRIEPESRMNMTVSLLRP